MRNSVDCSYCYEIDLRVCNYNKVIKESSAFCHDGTQGCVSISGGRQLLYNVFVTVRHVSSGIHVVTSVSSDSQLA